MIVYIPVPVLKALGLLDQAGFSAYLVGGCIRSLLLQASPKDYDITSDAQPEQVLKIFHDCHSVGTGMKHGTVLVVIDGVPLEITTYRIDGSYTDRRRPDRVLFTRNLEDDLARRDFTINAMAWTPNSNGLAPAQSTAACRLQPDQMPVRFQVSDVIDPFGGQEDLNSQLIRCVGDPARRFEEDPLRILRALRFSSVLGFSIEPRTSAALVETRNSLGHIAVERIQVEFSELLCGQNAAQTIRDMIGVIGVFLPELLSLRDFDPLNPQHHLDLLEHTLQVVAAMPANPTLRLAALLHDIGKPSVFSLDEQGIGRFYGHQQTGAELASDILSRLRYDKMTISRVCQLVLHHDSFPEATVKSVRKWLNRHGPELAHDLLILKEADILAQHPDGLEAKLTVLRQIRNLVGQILAEGHCLTLHDLAVKGQDLIELGYPSSRRIGRMLQALLEAVMDEQLPNQKAALIKAARNMMQNE